MGSIRLISGKFGGRILSTPAGNATHPMSERARAGIFSVLGSMGFDFAGARVLDLFAGSGALGFESLSRGAEQAVFIEKSRNAIESFYKNVRQLGLSDEEANLRAQNVFSFVGEVSFDLVFCDPPYDDSGKISIRLAEFLDNLPVSDKAVLVLSRPSDIESLKMEKWRLVDSKKYAEANIDFYLTSP